MKKLYFSIKFKIIFAIVFLILFFGTLATVFVYLQTNKIFIGLKSNELEAITVSQSEKIIQRLNMTRNVLKTISDNEKVKKYLVEDDEKYLKEVDQLLESQLIDDRFLAVYLLDGSGVAIASTDKRFVGNDYSFRNYFIKAISDGWGTDSAVGVTSKELGIYFSRVILNENRSPIGVVVVKVNPKSIESLIHIEESSGIDYLLTDECGVTLFSNNDAFKYNSLGVMDEETRGNCRLSERYPEYDIEPLGYGIVTETIRSGNIQDTIDFFDEKDGEDEIVSFNVMGDFPYIFVTEVNKEGFMGSSRDISGTVAIFVIIAAFSALVMISLLVSKYLSPIEDLKKAVNEYSKGNFTFRSDIRTNDEFGSLITILNSMAGDLDELYKNIENKVREKTAELEKINGYLTGRELKMIELKEKLKRMETKKK